MKNNFNSAERELIQFIAKRFPLTHPDVKLGIGDDTAAIIPPPKAMSLITTDTLVSGVHFYDIDSDYQMLGRKCLLVNISDIAAMGGTPRYFLLSLVVPSGFSRTKLADLIDGMAEEAALNQVVLLGGDCVGGDTLTITITLWGEVAPDKVIKRSGAQPGEGIYLTGQTGESAAGLRYIREARDTLNASKITLINRHLQPPNRIGFSRLVGENYPISSMIDLSDGLGEGLWELANAGAVGFLIEWNRIPISDLLHENFNLQQIEELCLYGGEDYELVFTAPVALAKAISAAARKEFDLPVNLIGTVKSADFGIQLKKDDLVSELTGAGFKHFDF